MLAIDYYELSGDATYLRDQLYPHLKQLDAFYRSYMTSTGGRYLIEHSAANEGGDDLNPNLDLGYFRRTVRTLLSTSVTLGLDADLRPVWQDVLDKLSPFPTGLYNGKTVYLMAENVKGSTAIADTFAPGTMPNNLEGGVFPGGNIYLGGDPAQLQIARDTLEQMAPWGLTSTSRFNGFCIQFPIAARVGWPADDLIGKLDAAITADWRASNVTAAQGGGGIETSGTIEAIDSMLLQSEGGVLRQFPVWPPARDAQFKRLRAKGAFLVSAVLASGEITAEITSEKGNAVAALSTWSKPAVDELDETGAISRATPSTTSGGVVRFDTTAGKTYRIRAAP